MSFERPLPASLSPSRLQDFQSCPRKFQHASIDRIPQPATKATALGRFVHYVLEQIFQLEAHERNVDKVADHLEGAVSAILTDDVRSDLGLTEETIPAFVREAEVISKNYFELEDATARQVEGVEQRINVEISGVPLVGILDRLDREADGSLTIVDYKTGRVPNANYMTSTFANTELYAAMCEASLNEMPARIRLFYVGAKEVIERPVTEIVVNARRKAAQTAWTSINTYYADGEFPAKPSANSCRFCAYKEICRGNGVNVPS